MAQDTHELVVAANADVYAAVSGTALPADNDADAALNAAYKNLGLISEDGIRISATPEIQEFFSMQRSQPVRRERIRQNISFGYTLQQWNVNNVPHAFGGGTVTETAAGVFKYTFPADSDALLEQALVIDWQDGSKKYRIAFKRVNITEGVEVSLVRNNLAMLSVTAQVLSNEDGTAPGFFLAEDVAFSSVS